jgi:hypothetical protein
MPHSLQAHNQFAIPASAHWSDEPRKFFPVFIMTKTLIVPGLNNSRPRKLHRIKNDKHRKTHPHRSSLPEFSDVQIWPIFRVDRSNRSGQGKTGQAIQALAWLYGAADFETFDAGVHAVFGVTTLEP